MPPPKSIDELFAEAMTRPAGPDREAWIREACGDDDGLEVDLRELIACHDSSSSFLAEPLVGPPDTESIGDPCPDRIGPYRIEAEIGRGGMGVVHSAIDTRLERRVAIKMLPAVLFADPGRLARLEREARAMGALNHPNIATIHGLEEHDGRRLLVLEHVGGEMLSERLDRGPLPIGEVRHVGAQIAAAVEASHDAGVVHRDLKPANVKITPDGTVKVLDFGLATSDAGSDVLFAGDDPGSGGSPEHRPTVPGAILGTAAYMSPEQARGRGVDRQTDVWSFGAILHECVTGTALFRGETPADTIGSVLHKEVTLDDLPRDTPSIVKHVLAGCLERDKARRLRDMRDVRLALENDASATRLLSVLPRRAERARLARWIAAAIVVVALLAAAGFALRPRSATTAGPMTTHVGVPISIPQSLWGGKKIVLNQTTPDGGASVTALLWGDPFVAAAISRDGRTIAYVGTNPNDPSPAPVAGIYVRSLDEPLARRLHGTDDAARLGFSPDGTQIAFIWWDRGSRRVEVRRVSVDGSPVATVLADTTGGAYSRYSTPLWLSDSELLVVSSSPPAVHRVPIVTGEPTLVARIDPAVDEIWSEAYHPVLTPGGRSALLTHRHMTGEGVRTSLIRVDLDSGATEPVLADAEYGIVLRSGHWSSCVIRRSARRSSTSTRWRSTAL